MASPVAFVAERGDLQFPSETVSSFRTERGTSPRLMKVLQRDCNVAKLLWMQSERTCQTVRMHRCINTCSACISSGVVMKAGVERHSRVGEGVC